MTYIVMETKKSYCIVLDEAGRFIKAANFNYEIGQTIHEIHELTAPTSAFTLRHLSVFVGSIAAAILFFFALQFYQHVMTPFASVYLQINPEVRMDINRSDQVVGLEALNEDGKNLLEGYNARRKDLQVVADELVDRAIVMGYLADGGAVTIRLDAPDEQWFLDKGITLRQNLNTHLQQKLSVTIHIIEYMEDEPYEPPKQTPRDDSEYLAPTPVDEDSGYDDEGDIDYESEYTAPSAPNNPPVFHDSGYDDSHYDDSDFDDSGYDDSDYDD